jgi:hypothetical protein
MNLSLSVSLFTDTLTRLLTNGPIAAEGWVLVPQGTASFEVRRALGNGHVPPLNIPDLGLIRIGTATEWSLVPALPDSLRILQSQSNSPAPALSPAGSDLILIGAQ